MVQIVVEMRFILSLPIRSNSHQTLDATNKIKYIKKSYRNFTLLTATDRDFFCMKHGSSITELHFILMSVCR